MQMLFVYTFNQTFGSREAHGASAANRVCLRHGFFDGVLSNEKTLR